MTPGKQSNEPSAVTMVKSSAMSLALCAIKFIIMMVLPVADQAGNKNPLSL